MAGVPAGTAAEYIREAHGRYFAGNHMGAETGDKISRTET